MQKYRLEGLLKNRKVGKREVGNSTRESDIFYFFVRGLVLNIGCHQDTLNHI